jgi:hypothetical protein
VVEDHVQQHADAGAVQGLDQVAELAPVFLGSPTQ